MNYYIMREDKRIKNKVVLEDFQTEECVEFQEADKDTLKDNALLFTLENENTIYKDMLEAPIKMVSEKVWRVIFLYEERVVTKKVSLVNKMKGTRYGYQLLLLNRIDCLHETSEFYKDQSVKRLVLDQNKIKGKEIFRIAGITPDIVVVSMHIAESVLRRESYGILFEKIDCQ